MEKKTEMFSYDIVSDPQIYQLNEKTPVSTHYFGDEEKYVKSLNGVYKFNFSKNYDECPKDFWKNDVDVSDWDEIRFSFRATKHHSMLMLYIHGMDMKRLCLDRFQQSTILSIVM